jgi:uncharacterized protein YndB with AHSA1/START domain
VSQAHVTLEESFPVPPEVLFAAMADHEGMGRWTGADVRVIEGPADGGVGTVRRITNGPLSFDETVTYFDPPRRMVYRVTRGLPIVRFHRGEVLVAPWGKTGSTLRWDIRIDSRIPGVAALLTRVLGRALRDGLGHLRQELLAASADAA